MDTKTSFSARQITKRYSSSFSMAIRALGPELRQPFYNLYAWLRVADQIVDSPDQPIDRTDRLAKFKQATELALTSGFSPNPIIETFRQTVIKFKIDPEMIDAFFASMTMDLTVKRFDQAQSRQYIYGSAEVVGLMSLKVFCRSDQPLFNQLEVAARSLGSAFQKINFLRDLRSDWRDLDRVYFPGVEPDRLNRTQKIRLEAEIWAELETGKTGLNQLPTDCRRGVLLAYNHYCQLLKQISSLEPDQLLKDRVSVPPRVKFWLVIQTYLTPIRLTWPRAGFKAASSK